MFYRLSDKSFFKEKPLYERPHPVNICYFALTTFFVFTFKELLSLYGRNSKYKNPITSKNATTVPIPNAPVVMSVPIW